MMANQGEIRVSPEDHGAVATCQPLMAAFYPKQALSYTRFI